MKSSGPLEPEPGPGSSLLTKLRRTDEIADSAHAAVVLPLWLVQLHPDPLTAGELRGSTEPQGSGLRWRQKGSGMNEPQSG